MRSKGLSLSATKRLLMMSLIFSLISIIALVGCRQSPEYQVDSFEDLKQELRNYPDNIFFDLSFYEEGAELYYFVSHKVKTNQANDTQKPPHYSIRSEPASRHPHDNDLRKTEVDTVLTYLAVNNLDLPTDYHKPRSLWSEEYRDIAVSHQITEYTVLNSRQANFEMRELQKYYDYPYRTLSYHCSFNFILRDFEYTIYYEYAITPEELEQGLAEGIHERAQSEIESLADSIIDQFFKKGRR